MIIRIYVGGKITPEKAKTGWIGQQEDHIKRHSALRPCIDAFLEYEINGERGILLLYRNNIPPYPKKAWVPGGEWKRGILDPIEALKLKVKEETGLDIKTPEYLGMASMLWEESPYNTPEFLQEREKKKLGEGIHDIGHVFFARASGNLKLKTMTPPILIVTLKNFEKMMSEHNVHDYIRTFTWEALKKVR